MFNLLIVDDEPMAVERLSTDIEWSEIGIDKIFKAYSGKKVLECLNKNRIDVMLVDIRMPEITGLELVEIINNRCPETQIVLISGYDEFEYAQKAIDLEVFSYLTKPTAYEEIKEVVKRALANLKEIRFKNKALKEAEKKLDNLIPILQERYLTKWIIYGRNNPLRDADKLKSCRLGINQVFPALLILVKINTELTVSNNTLTEIALRSLAEEILLSNHQALFLKDHEENLIFFLQAKTDELRQVITSFNETVPKFQRLASKTVDKMPSILWSEPTDLALIPRAYNNLINRLHRSIQWSSGVIMGPETILVSKHIFNLRDIFDYFQLSLLIETLQGNKAVNYIKSVFDEINKQTEISYGIFQEIYYVVAGILIGASNKRGITLTEWAEKGKEEFYNYELLDSCNGLQRWCIESIRQFTDYVITKENSQNNLLIEEIKRWVYSHLGKDITLGDIANHLYLHPNYLSRLFKEKEGISLSEYIINLKINEARKLLKNPKTKVYQVAAEIGYSSAYFCRLFKRETGLSPKKYQNIK